MKVEQLARKSAAALPVGDGDGKDFRLILYKPRQDKSVQLGAVGCPVCDHMPVKKQTFDLLFASTATE